MGMNGGPQLRLDIVFNPASYILLKVEIDEENNIAIYTSFA
jgi:hypothetical protein